MTTPDWPTCIHANCAGIQIEGFMTCLAHLPSDKRGQIMAVLKRGADLDARGTPINSTLLAEIMGAARPRVLGKVNFAKAEFSDVEELGSLIVDTLILDGARFKRSMRIEVVAKRVSCVGTQFDAGVTLRADYAEIDASRTVFGSASTISGLPWPRWVVIADWVEKHLGPRGPDSWRPVLVSLQGTDVSNLVLVDTDLSKCMFAGAHRLDQLRLEGRCRFSSPVKGARRQMLAEEQLFGASDIEPERIAALYRSLRKAFEDSKNEAGAGDFYYGEMEMRRRSSTTSWTERWILTLYWLLSGYGQRAGRTLVAMGILIATVFVLLLTVGLPGQPIWTWPRVDQSLRIAMGAVVFREAGQQLTSLGNWTVMIARFLGPVLLALAVLAIRARVKR